LVAVGKNPEKKEKKKFFFSLFRARVFSARGKKRKKSPRPYFFLLFSFPEVANCNQINLVYNARKKNRPAPFLSLFLFPEVANCNQINLVYAIFYNARKKIAMFLQFCINFCVFWLQRAQKNCHFSTIF
jgi:hypothetical protein